MSVTEDMHIRTELFFFDMAEASPVGIYHADTQGHYTYANNAWRELHDLDINDCLGDGWVNTLHPDDLQRVLAEWQETVDTGRAFFAEFRIKKTNSEIRYARSMANPIINWQGEISGYVGTVEDITAYKIQQLRETASNQILNLIINDSPLKTILEAIVYSVEAEHPSMRCSILLLDESGKHLLNGAAPSLPDFYNQAVHGLAIGPKAGSCGAAAFSGQMVLAENIQTDPHWEDYRELAAKAELGACWSEPIRDHSGKILGTFGIYHRQPHAASATDITIIKTAAQLATVAIERNRSAMALKKSQLYLQTAIDGLTSHICLLDDRGNIILTNKAWRNFSAANQGIAEKTLEGANYIEACRISGDSDDNAEKFRNGVLDVLYGDNEHFEMEYECHADNELRWFVGRATKCSNSDIFGAVIAHENITSRKLAEENIWYQANFDSLTKLPNRNMFHDRLNLEIRKDQREQKPFALLFIDLDHFKGVNDTLGHNMGDTLLVEAAARIRNCLRESDTVARIGGDEFTVILSGMKNPATIEQIAQTLITELAQPFQLDTEQVFVSASIGITLYPGDATTMENLLKYADQAMYVAKNAGRNRYSFFTISLQQAAEQHRRLSIDLRNAVTQQQFELYYQPIVELATGSIHKAEALLRWHHPQRGIVAPADFIPLAEETGLISDIGDWVFKQAVQRVKQWRALCHPKFQISINKSPVQFHGSHNHCEQLWLNYLHEAELDGDSISIEITENLLLNNADSVTHKLTRFRHHGLSISLDDFGTGYSSLSYLKKFAIDFIKIDQSFIHDLDKNPDNLAICEAMIMMAHKLDIKVIAEGVETEAVRKLLLAAGCDYAQGYLFMRPVPAAEFIKGLRI